MRVEVIDLGSDVFVWDSECYFLCLLQPPAQNSSPLSLGTGSATVTMATAWKKRGGKRSPRCAVARSPQNVAPARGKGTPPATAVRLSNWIVPLLYRYRATADLSLTYRRPIVAPLPHHQIAQRNRKRDLLQPTRPNTAPYIHAPRTHTTEI